MVTIKFQGRDIEADLINISSSDDDWSDFTLEDGTVIKIKTILTKVLRATTEKTEIGEPLYILQMTQITTTEVNPELMTGDD